jgi:putative ABC transport system ATP-binding protein
MLKITDLIKSFREPTGQPLPILNVPAYSIDAGEQVAMVGPSGGGKTTLLHIIAGIVKADSGSIELDGVDLAKLGEVGRDRVRAHKIGYIFQTFNLLPAFTALENVKLGMAFASKPNTANRAEDLLKQVGLGDRLHHKPHALSVGQQQRVAVARALGNRPKLILADEPTANVDAKNQQRIIDLIREVATREQVALLMVTHSSEIASQFDRVDELESINRVAVASA